MSIFDEYMKSTYAKEVFAQESLLQSQQSTFPKQLARFGAIFSIEKIYENTSETTETLGTELSDSSKRLSPNGWVSLKFYLRSPIAALFGDTWVKGKEAVFTRLKQRNPDFSDTELHMVMQDLMMSPQNRIMMSKIFHSKHKPALVLDKKIYFPAIVGMHTVTEIRGFLLKLLRNGVFDPGLKIREKGQIDQRPEALQEINQRLQDVAKAKPSELPYYKPKADAFVPSDELVDADDYAESLRMQLQKEKGKTGSMKFAQSVGQTFWYLNIEGKTIEGPFDSLEGAATAQDQQLGESDNIDMELLDQMIDEAVDKFKQTINPEYEEELAMAAGLKDQLQRLAELGNSLDAKGEMELANQVDKVIKACYDVTPSYDAVKEFHPKGGSPDTRDGHGKVLPGDTRTETITEQQKADLEVALRNPTGKVACTSCGLTHIAETVVKCPSCNTAI